MPHLPEGVTVNEPTPDVCPTCGRVMSKREAAEQGACNDCHGGPYDGGAFDDRRAG